MWCVFSLHRAETSTYHMGTCVQFTILMCERTAGTNFSQMTDIGSTPFVVDERFDDQKHNMMVIDRCGDRDTKDR